MGKIWVEDAQGHPKQIDEEQASDYAHREQFTNEQAKDLRRQESNRSYAEANDSDLTAGVIGAANGLAGGLALPVAIGAGNVLDNTGLTEGFGLHNRRMAEGDTLRDPFKAGEAAGVILPAMFGDEAGLLGMAGGATERLAGRVLPELPGLLGSASKAVLRLGARGAAEGAILNTTQNVQQNLIQNHPLTAESIAASAADGALFGGLAGGAVGGLGSVLGRGVEEIGARKAAGIMNKAPAVEGGAMKAYSDFLESRGAKLTDPISKIRKAVEGAEGDFAKIRSHVIEQLDNAGMDSELRTAHTRVVERAKIELSPTEFKAATKVGKASFNEWGWKDMMNIRDALAAKPKVIGTQKLMGIIDSEMTSAMRAAEEKMSEVLPKMKGMTDQYVSSYIGGKMARELSGLTESGPKSGIGKLFSMSPQELAYAGIWSATGNIGGAAAHLAARQSGKVASALLGRGAEAAIPKTVGEAVVRNAQAARAAATVQAISGRISQAVRGFFSRTRAEANLVNRDSSSAKHYSRAEFERTAEDARELTSDSHAGRVNDYAGTDLANISPKLAEESVKAYQRAQQYLGPQIPQSRKAQKSQSLRPLPIPKGLDMKEFKFMRINDAIRHPMSVMDRVENGTVSRDEMAAVKFVYPELHAQIVESAQEGIMEMKQAGKSMDIQKITQLGLILGAPVDSILSREFIAETQRALHVMPDGQQGPGQPQPQAGNITQDVANSGLLTPIDKAVLVS